MKIQIRQGVFESNSSSTHTLTMMMKDDYDEWWKSGKYLYRYNWNFRKLSDDESPVDRKLYTQDEAMAFILKVTSDIEVNDISASFDDIRKDYGFVAFNDSEDSNLETYEDTFTTPGGEIVVAFGEYGYD